MNKSTTYQNSGDSRTGRKYIADYEETFEDVLKAGEALGKEKFTFWNKLKRRYYEEGLVVQEFIPAVEERVYWRMFFNLNAHQTDLGNAVRRGPATYNEELRQCFNESNSVYDDRFLNNLEQQLNLRGYFIPIEDLANLSQQTIQDTLAWRTHLNDHINIVGFLRSLKLAQKDYGEVELPVLGFWTYLKVYAKAIRDIYKKNSDSVTPNIWISDAIDRLRFQALPSIELVQLLFRLIEQQFGTDEHLSLYQSTWAQNSQESHVFYADNKTEIERFLLSNSADYSSAEFLVLKDAFFRLCARDIECMQVQELLDNHSGENIIGLMSANFKETFGSGKKRSIGERMRNAIGGISIMDRIKGMSHDGASEAMPSLYPPVIEIQSEDTEMWYEYSSEQLSEIQHFIKNDLSPSDYQRLTEIAERRVRMYHQNLANVITGPVLIWHNENGMVIPQFDGLTDPRTNQYAEYFWKRQSQEDEDRALLKDLILQITELVYPSDVRRFANNVPSFQLFYIAEEWEVAWKNHMEALSSRLKYRSGRMREFGILLSYEIVDRRRDIWLDEMLRIEAEVKPYIGFVKKAFAAALPVRQKVDFNPYRHKSDGVEFDPETIMDQNKWLRGNIMKSLRFETTVGKIEQVNSFCLDFSSSMDHDRMRGLFKILYLLVLGLEDRKTYDAIHFFGTTFISTAPFRTGYTDRSVLFSILSKIGKITKNGVLYRGLGGTNISEGIRMCHMEIENFNELLLRQNPNANLASSLFVLTDGEPTVGIVGNEDLHDFIEDLREGSNVIIKGIYLNPNKEKSGFVQQIFGDDHFIEAHTFKDTVNAFVSLMTKTYKQQRKDYRWEQKKRKVEGELD